MGKLLIPVCLVFLIISPAFTHIQGEPACQDMIFAVLDNGATIEPFAKIEDGKLVPALTGSEDADKMKQFDETCYNPGTSYSLIYGGKAAGTVTVKKSNIGTDCGGQTAQVTFTSAKTKLKGFEMALATNFRPLKAGTGVRRSATPAEKATIDKLVTAEYRKNNSGVKGMKAVKLTVADVNNDKKNEFAGTYIVSPSAGERGLLFFIALRTASGAYRISYSNYQQVTKEEVMSGDLADVDTGIYQEMLLDMLDINNDGVAEVFTVSHSFEGVSFYTYQWDGKQWSRLLDTANYHCAW